MRSRLLFAILFTVSAATTGVLSPLLRAQSSPASATTLARHVARGDFNPLSVTFVSLSEGLTLGTESCTKGSLCLAMMRTLNGGRAWSARSLPASILNVTDRTVGSSIAALAPGNLNIRFAGAQDGWIYGAVARPEDVGYNSVFPVPVLWSTHDGGVTWSKVVLPDVTTKQGSILDLEAANGTVYALTLDGLHTHLESSPVGADHWGLTKTVGFGIPAGGGPLTGSIVLQGHSGWLVEGNDRGISASAQLNADGKWVAWASPCRQVGDGYVVPAASSPTDLVAVCAIGGYGVGPSKADPPGKSLGNSWLYASDNAGATFRYESELRPLKEFTNYDFGGGLVASSAKGVVFVNRMVGSAGSLVVSFDDGAQWNVAYGRAPFYLGFTSPTQGVGIVTFAHINKLIMSYDGGRHWAPVVF